MIKKVFTVILILSAIVALYGAVGFFINNSLWPNGGTSGRLPSLYLILGGIAGMLVGVGFRDLKSRPDRKR